MSDASARPHAAEPANGSRDATGGAAPFPFAPGAYFQPPPEYGRLRETCPLAPVVMPSGTPARLALRHADVREALGDPRFTRDLTFPGAPRFAPGLSVDDDPFSISNMDPPEHSRLRRIASSAFTPRRVASWRPRVEEIAEELADGFGAPPVDLVEAYALPLPTLVICELLGVPAADRDRFRAWSDAFLSTSELAEDERVEQFGRFLDYAAALVAERRATPGGGLLDAMIEATDQGATFTEDELVHMVVTLILAGHETTRTMIARGMFTLLRHPEQYLMLCRGEASVAGAVEEILRFDVPADAALLRLARQAVALPAGPVGPGEVVIPVLASANRDPGLFDRPDVFDVTRADNPHLAFGHGPHYCMGANLARMELEVAVGTLARRHPALRLAAAPEEIRWTDGGLMHGPRALPVTF
ncbi:cytochrome P450 [Nonomuraea sp. NPDC050691]|uniref:cytochrome P450 n=1 Tax=Nonomuraea sp. NPDC050691 TaxID=3155661 RepID=UPI0033DF8C35